MRILVIEDEHRIAQAIHTGLTQERFLVDVAYDGEQGLDFATGEKYDLFVIDLMLPNLDGLSVCKQIRKQNIHTPILILTAKDDVESKITGLNTGADDYLTKPFAFTELLARVRALLRRPPVATSALLSYGDLSLDPVSFVVKRTSQLVELSPKEFSLLEYLLRHPQQVLTKAQLIEQVWEYDADILPNTLEVTIRHLRQKLEAPFPHLAPMIHTVRGFGYKLGP
jgi:DNA-binding response OmpR family regulator